MANIIKYYIDIGSIYEGDELIKQAYKDHYNWTFKNYGLIGILKLEIDIKKRKKTEIFFKQISYPYVYQFSKDLITNLIYEKKSDNDIMEIFGEFRDANLIVTWNGRDFDIPIIINNLKYTKEYTQYCINCVSKKDRDLLDISILRHINVKGGLQAVAKRLDLNQESNYKCCPEYTENDLGFLSDFDRNTNIHNNCLRIARYKNEYDIRILPLLEERLGFLYEPRSFFDKYHKNWNR